MYYHITRDLANHAVNEARLWISEGGMVKDLDAKFSEIYHKYTDGKRGILKDWVSDALNDIVDGFEWGSDRSVE